MVEMLLQIKAGVIVAKGGAGRQLVTIPRSRDPSRHVDACAIAG